MQSLTELLAKVQEALVSVLCSSFSVKMVLSSEKTFAAAASRIISLTAARLTVISCVFFFVSFCGF